VVVVFIDCTKSENEETVAFKEMKMKKKGISRMHACMFLCVYSFLCVDREKLTYVCEYHDYNCLGSS
jgi:hypothetical protein